MRPEDLLKDDIVADDIVVVGRVGAPFGIKGYLKIHSYTEPSNNLMQYQPWLLKIRGQWQKVSVDHVEENGQGIIARLGGIIDRDLARRYTNCEIGVYKTELPTLTSDEFYWKDLVGLTVYDTQNHELGVVTSMMETGSNDVLVIKGKSGEFAVPFIMDTVVIKVDLPAKTIIIDWSE